MNIPFSPPDISEAEIEKVTEVLRSGWITTGPKTKEFEERIAEYCGNKKAVCLNSATAAMELTLRILGVGEGDEVIVPAYTYTATASVVCHVGARLVMVDTAKDSFEMDYEKLEAAITEKTKVIIPVDLAGVLCDYRKIFEIVEKKKSLFYPANELQKDFGRIIVMADAAHGFGAFQLNGKKQKEMCGAIADFTCFSFHAVKNLTTAEGGAVTWRERKGIDSQEIYQKYMLLSLHGQSKDALAKTQIGAWEYDIVAPYYKCNMTDIMAAIGLGQLERYEELLNYRKEIVEKYDFAIEEWSKKHSRKIHRLSHITEEKVSSCHLYLIRIDGLEEQQRNMIITKMAEKGVATNVHYKPLPMLSAYKNQGFKIEDYPHAYSFYKNELTLPLHTKLTDKEVEYIIEQLFAVLENV